MPFIPEAARNQGGILGLTRRTANAESLLPEQREPKLLAPQHHIKLPDESSAASREQSTCQPMCQCCSEQLLCSAADTGSTHGLELSRA